MAELRDTAIWAATCDLKAQVLPNARRPLLVRSVVPGAVLVAAGVAGLAVVPVIGGVLVALGLLPLAAALAVARHRGRLLLEGDGFTYRALPGRVISLSWQECGPFRVVRPPLGGARRVGWSGRDADQDADRGGSFLPGAGDLPAEDLSVLLNRYRQRFAPDKGPTDRPTT